MLTRVRCLLRLHRWQHLTDDGGRYRLCRDCSKWKREVTWSGAPEPQDY